jgi:hypothetical protein
MKEMAYAWATQARASATLSARRQHATLLGCARPHHLHIESERSVADHEWVPANVTPKQRKRSIPFEYTCIQSVLIGAQKTLTQGTFCWDFLSETQEKKANHF